MRLVHGNHGHCVATAGSRKGDGIMSLPPIAESVPPCGQRMKPTQLCNMARREHVGLASESTPFSAAGSRERGTKVASPPTQPGPCERRPTTAAADAAAAWSTLTRPVNPRATPTASAVYVYRHLRPGQPHR